MSGLPPVPALDAQPAPGGGEVVSRAAAESPAPAATPKKPSGAWFRKRAEAKRRGIEPPPLPPGTTLNPRRSAPGPVRDNAANVLSPPPASEPERVTLPNEATVEGQSIRAGDRIELRLTPGDVEAAQAEAAQAAEAEHRRTALVLGRDELVKRVGAFGGLAFTMTGVLLGDVPTWELKDVERDSLAALFVDAWPEECAAMMQDGGMTKVIAIVTLGQVVRGKWTLYKAKRKDRSDGPVRDVSPSPSRAETAASSGARRPIIPADMRAAG